MSSSGAVVRHPAFFVLLAGGFFTLLCLPFVVLDPPLDLFAAGLFRYFFAVWAAAVVLLLGVAVRLGRDGRAARAPDDRGEDRA